MISAVDRVQRIVHRSLHHRESARRHDGALTIRVDGLDRRLVPPDDLVGGGKRGRGRDQTGDENTGQDWDHGSILLDSGRDVARTRVAVCEGLSENPSRGLCPPESRTVYGENAGSM